jgi:hypothetical protein
MLAADEYYYSGGIFVLAVFNAKYLPDVVYE